MGIIFPKYKSDFSPQTEDNSTLKAKLVQLLQPKAKAFEFTKVNLLAIRGVKMYIVVGKTAVAQNKVRLKGVLS